MATRTLGLLASAALLVFGVLLGGAPAALAQPAVELAAQAGPASERIPGRYIVVFNDRVTNPVAEAARMMRGTGGEIHHSYRHALRGFAATIPAAAFQGIRMNPNVAYVEPDATVSKWNITQTSATWGIDRIDQRSLPLNGEYTYAQDGTGVYAYILDTGIRSSHAEFSGRMAPGATAINDGRGTEDCDGHGTHVAGTVGGTVYGVAKGVTLVPVRVLDCNGSGTWSGVIAGIDWVAGEKRANPNRPMVANMSLGGGALDSVDTAVNNAAADGVVMVVAAGNDNANACNYSPARATGALTVGSTTSSDARSSFSNYGNCVNLFAPGSSITAAWYTSNTAIATLSGTSMASPHVAGVAALVLGGDGTATEPQVRAAILDGATANVVTNPGTGSPNLLVYSLVSSGPLTPTVDVEPAVIDTTVSSNRNWTSATATVLVVESTSPYPVVPNATVSGSWKVSGALQSATQSAVTDVNGNVSFSSGNYRTSSTSSLAFCVRSISGTGITPVTYDTPLCVGTGNMPGASPPEDAPLTITTSSLPNGTVGTAYTATLVAEGGGGSSYVWSIRDGEVLPDGLSLSGSGVISGTPTAPGSSSFTVQVTSGSVSATAGLSITVVEATGGDTTPPVVESSNSTRSTSGPWQRADGTWTVSDDQALATVTVEMLAPGGSVLDAATVAVSGTLASGSFSLRSRTGYESVRITVVDAAGNPTSEPIP